MNCPRREQEAVPNAGRCSRTDGALLHMTAWFLQRLLLLGRCQWVHATDRPVLLEVLGRRRGCYTQGSRDLFVSWAVKLVQFVLLNGNRSKVPSHLSDTHEDGWGKKEKRDKGQKALGQA